MEYSTIHHKNQIESKHIRIYKKIPKNLSSNNFQKPACPKTPKTYALEPIKNNKPKPIKNSNQNRLLSIKPTPGFRTRTKKITEENKSLCLRLPRTPTLITFSNSKSIRTEKNISKALEDYSIFKTERAAYSIKQHKSIIKELREYYKTVPLVSIELIKSKAVYLPKKPSKLNKKTIIFDLEGTLIHYCDALMSTQVRLEITLSSGGQINSGMWVRPFAINCLKRASELFEVIIFSSFDRSYTDKIIDFLDPDHDIIDHRLFKDSCIEIDGNMIKDLRIFINRELKNLIIVDKSCYSFIFQLENGIPVSPWAGEHYDKDLVFITNYIESLSISNDIREINNKTFGFNKVSIIT
jgi:Dullard-like phosphatase family protein